MFIIRTLIFVIRILFFIMRTSMFYNKDVDDQNISILSFLSLLSLSVKILSLSF